MLILIGEVELRQHYEVQPRLFVHQSSANTTMCLLCPNQLLDIMNSNRQDLQRADQALKKNAFLSELNYSSKSR